MKISNQKKVFFSAVSTLLITTLTLTYATYSWFNMNRTVKAENMRLVATVPIELEISLTGSDDDDDWGESVTISMSDAVKATVGAGYDNTKTFSLMPASTYTGFNNTIYQTSKAARDGSALPGTVFNAGHSAQLGWEEYEGHYIDIPLYFRSTGTENRELHLKTEDVVENGTYVKSADGSNLYKIARFAFLNMEGTANSMNENDPLVYASPDQTMGERCVVTSATDATTTRPDYIQFTDKISNEAILPVYAATYTGDTYTYNVSSLIVRVWIEGQDNSCVANVGKKSFQAGLEFYAKDI